MLALETGLLAWGDLPPLTQMLAAPSEWVESFTLVALAVLAAAQQKFLAKIFQLKTPPHPRNVRRTATDTLHCNAKIVTF